MLDISQVNFAIIFSVSDMENKFNDNEIRLNNLAKEIAKLNERMAEYYETIQTKASNYRNCKP